MTAQTHGFDNLQRLYSAAIRRLHGLGVMVNASLVFGMDEDTETVFNRTVEWLIAQGVETATFHVLTPYPGTALHRRMVAEGRITTTNWSLYDTRHAVFRPARMSAEALEAGYWRAYRDFYRWGSILQSAWSRERWLDRLRHVVYAGGWKKLEPFWDWVIRAKRVSSLLPLLEVVLEGNRRSAVAGRSGARAQRFTQGSLCSPQGGDRRPCERTVRFEQTDGLA